MIRLVCQYHVRHEGDSWLITVNPRHSAFYRRVLGFVPIGPCRSYSAVGDHPAEAFLLDVDLMRESVPKKHWEIFGESLPWAVLTPSQWPADYAQDFAARPCQEDRETTLEMLAMAGVADRDEVETRETTDACGSWHSRRCSPITAGS